MTRCADAFTPDDQADSAHPPGVHERAAPEARSALRRAVASMRVAADALGAGDGDPAHPAVVRLSAAGDCLAAGHDLLQTHFAADPVGSRLGNSPWAPLIVSAPIGAALLAEMTGLRHRLASWAIRLAAPHPADAALPAQALAAVISGCQWLRVAEAATWAADSHRPSAAADRALLHAIPANAPRRGTHPAAAHSAARPRWAPARRTRW